jgi:hypothetical protein
LAQLVIDEREEVGRGLAVAGRGGIEQARHVGQGPEYNRYSRRRYGTPASPGVYSFP